MFCSCDKFSIHFARLVSRAVLKIQAKSLRSCYRYAWPEEANPGKGKVKLVFEEAFCDNNGRFSCCDMKVSVATSECW